MFLAADWPADVPLKNGCCGQLWAGERAKLGEPLLTVELDESLSAVLELDVEPGTELRLVDRSGWVRVESARAA